MTACNASPLPFATLNGRRVEADFSGGDLTTDAGALLLREADRRLGLLDALDRCLPDPRDPDLITHPQRALLAQRVFGTFAYAAGSWDRVRRAIAKAEHNALGANPRFAVTNVPGDPQALYDDVYCARGEMENRIKEQQLMLFADRTSCQQFVANQFRLLLSAAAYVLVEAVRRLGLAGTDLERAQVSTIRLRLFEVAALIQRSTRRVLVRLASGYPWRELFGRVLRRLRGEADEEPSVVASG